MADNREAVMEWQLDLYCPMSDGEGLRVEVSDDSETVAFLHLVPKVDLKPKSLADPAPMPAWEETYLCQTDDLETAAAFFVECARLCRLTKKHIKARYARTEACHGG